MLTLATALLVLAAGNGTALWFNAYEVRGGGVEIPQAGQYIVWVWAKAGRPVHLTLGEKKLEVNRKRQEKDLEYVWVRAGELHLPQGGTAITLSSDIVALALSTEAAFEPKAVMGDMRVYDGPRAVEDRRARTAKHTDTVFTMPHYASRDAWETYAEGVRRRILLSSALLPLPTRTPLNAKVFDRTTRDDYTVEKVLFEARPGFLVTGNLYRPIGQGPFPGVVCPHGHWGNGRLEDGERGSVPARCITLARMGAVVFSYDMIGYNDSMQFTHNWGGEREKLWGVHPFAMQLWSGMRAVDFVQGLPEVDPERIGCTGASGGGTQTFALMAVDPRIKVAAPVNMISSTMQGGCLCENAPILRLDNSNMEIGALMAPRPLLMVSATGDWTRETPHVEYPAIRSIYALYGAEDRVVNVHIDAPHNYNLPSREAMYRFFGKWLLGRDDVENFSEPPYEKEPDSALRVFADKKDVATYPGQDAVIASVIDANRAKWQAILPKRLEDVPAFRETYGTALADVLGATIPAPNDFDSERVSMEEREGYVVERWVISRASMRDAIPALLYRAKDPAPQDAVVLAHGEGKAAFADIEKGGPGPLVAGLMAQGKAVLCIDTFLTGEHHAPDKRTVRHRQGRFMDTFQPTDTGYRVQDIVTALAFLRARRDMTGNINLAGLGEAGLWCLFASAIDGRVPVTVADASRFPADDAAWVDTYYVPCIRSAGDVQTAAVLVAPRRLAVMNTGECELSLLGAQIAREPLSAAELLETLE